MAKGDKPKKARKAKKARSGKRVPKAQKTATAAAAPKPARAGGEQVEFGVHGLGKIMAAVHNAGLGTELNAHLKEPGQFVKVSQKSLTAIRDFVKKKPELASLAKTIGDCDCPPDDPGCVYIPG